MVGYLVRPLTASPQQDQEAARHLHTLAQRLGHQLTRVFRDQRHGRPAAAIAMLAYTRNHSVDVVALVGVDDLAEPHRAELVAAGIRIVNFTPRHRSEHGTEEARSDEPQRSDSTPKEPR
ncbi:hypothetical protein ACFV9C_43930 [Kribbella sp. NPDC059898]|uniref:hypothetical protein n=1 Tax=Kribbella sp. NPDC059898 TaxID=3346995 RepID=UPI003661244B